jgi:hypothetical protein
MCFQTIVSIFKACCPIGSTVSLEGSGSLSANVRVYGFNQLEPDSRTRKMSFSLSIMFLVPAHFINKAEAFCQQSWP